MSGHKPYFTDEELRTIHALLSGAQPEGMTAHEQARAERVRGKLREWADTREARKAKRAGSAAARE